MSSTFWFLLEFSVLLALAAVSFGFLGWMWRGSERGERAAKLEKELDEQRRLARAAMDERDAARAEKIDTSVHVSDAARLIQESEALEAANTRLRDDLNVVRREHATLTDALTKADEVRNALEAEITKLQAESAQKNEAELHTAHAQITALQQQLAQTAESGQKAAANLESELRAANTQIAALQQQLAQSTESGQKAAHDLESELRAANTQIATLQQQLAQSTESGQKAAHDLESELRAANTQIAALQQQLAQSTESGQKAAHSLESELDAANTQIAALHQQLAQTTESGQKAAHNLESELLTARSTISRLEADLAALRESRASTPPVSSVPSVPSTPPPKPKAPRAKAPSAPKKAAQQATAQQRVDQIAHDLAPQLAVIAALTQERDDWQRRVSMLQSKTPADPAGLALARRSLAGSEERLSTAQSAVESLQNQKRALEKTIAQTAELTGTPDDDLTKIKGIKSVLSDQLHAHGIRTWRQIASWDDDDLRAFSELLAFKNRAARDHWQDQARLLMQQ